MPGRQQGIGNAHPAYQPWRKTSQNLLPLCSEPTRVGQYDIYPAFNVGSGKITAGYDDLAAIMARYRVVTIDGYGGVFWQPLKAHLDAALHLIGLAGAGWHCVEEALRPEREIREMCAPFLGGEDPLFGTRFTGTLRDFFDVDKLQRLQPDENTPISIVYGCGAALAGWDGLLIYVDLPKNEIQFRSRAGSVTNLGLKHPQSPEAMYKRFYFVDWVALNRHKEALLPRIDLVVDGQRPDVPMAMQGPELRTALHTMSQNYFRVRPWFEPGTWGGQWIKGHIPQVPRDVPNYAWSFELISPENGLLLQSDGLLLEVSFDFLMFQESWGVIGDAADQFGTEFPIRFDFLDTFQGGNLSVQCHPRHGYIRRLFGENFTQDETYYILDCVPGARVYLGFKDDIDPQAFRGELERSRDTGEEVDVDHFVNSEPAHKHDLFLIPNGTIHCSGIGNLVLEISATPYIFTFKMYDWVRKDLNGKMRHLNIERAFDNLYFERRGARVRGELIAHPTVLEEGEDWRLVHLPTHKDQFYDVHRLEFTGAIEVSTDGSCQVMNLVEGEAVLLETEGGLRSQFNYGETFVVPAAAHTYRLTNLGSRPAKVVKAFVKPGTRLSE